MFPRQLRIAFGHLNVRVAEDFRKLVKIAAVHHVPGCKRVTQIVEAEILNTRPFKQVLDTSFHALPSAYGPRFRRENPILTNHGGIAPQLTGISDISYDLC